jgi:hypothetical protein
MDQRRIDGSRDHGIVALACDVTFDSMAVALLTVADRPLEHDDGAQHRSSLHLLKRAGHVL